MPKTAQCFTLGMDSIELLHFISLVQQASSTFCASTKTQIDQSKIRQGKLCKTLN